MENAAGHTGLQVTAPGEVGDLWIVWQRWKAGALEGRRIVVDHQNPIALLQAVRAKLGLRVDDHPIGRLR